MSVTLTLTQKKEPWYHHGHYRLTGDDGRYSFYMFDHELHQLHYQIHQHIGYNNTTEDEPIEPLRAKADIPETLYIWKVEGNVARLIPAYQAIIDGPIEDVPITYSDFEKRTAVTDCMTGVPGVTEAPPVININIDQAELEAFRGIIEAYKYHEDPDGFPDRRYSDTAAKILAALPKESTE